MDIKTGKIRALQAGEAANEGEVVFQVGEEVEIKGCLFEVADIAPDPDNKVVLTGKPKS